MDAGLEATDAERAVYAFGQEFLDRKRVRATAFRSLVPMTTRLSKSCRSMSMVRANRDSSELRGRANQIDAAAHIIV